MSQGGTVQPIPFLCFLEETGIGKTAATFPGIRNVVAAVPIPQLYANELWDTS